MIVTIVNLILLFGLILYHRKRTKIICSLEDEIMDIKNMENEKKKEEV